KRCIAIHRERGTALGSRFLGNRLGLRVVDDRIGSLMSHDRAFRKTGTSSFPYLSGHVHLSSHIANSASATSLATSVMQMHLSFAKRPKATRSLTFASFILCFGYLSLTLAADQSAE